MGSLRGAARDLGIDPRYDFGMTIRRSTQADAGRGYWERMGHEDPMWAVLSDPGKEAESGGWELDDFFAGGYADVTGLRSRAEALDLAIGSGRALDFGCGVGRLTQALGQYHDEVVGIDIAESMVTEATRLALERNVAEVSFQVSTTAALPFADGEFDFALTLIVLQHLSPNQGRSFIKELIRVVMPGGALVFQIPSHVKSPSEPETIQQKLLGLLPEPIADKVRSARINRPGVGNHPMNGIRLGTVARIIEASGATLVAAVEDSSSGDAWCSYRYFVRC